MSLGFCRPFGSQFLSPPTALSANAAVVRGTPCSSQSLLVKSCCPTGKEWVLSSQVPTSLPLKVIVMGLESVALERCVPDSVRCQRAFPSGPYTALFSSLWTSPVTLSQERQLRKYSCSCSTLKCESQRAERVKSWSFFSDMLYQKLSFCPKAGSFQWPASITTHHHFLNCLISPDPCLSHLNSHCSVPFSSDMSLLCFFSCHSQHGWSSLSSQITEVDSINK